MTMRNATITVDADIAEAWNSTSAAKRKRLQGQIREWIGINGQTKKNAPHLSRKESELLARINQLPDLEKRRRIEELTDKMEYESITDEEHAELLRLSDEMESFSVDRLQAVIDLAKHRKVPPAELMKQLGLVPGKHAR